MSLIPFESGINLKAKELQNAVIHLVTDLSEIGSPVEGQVAFVTGSGASAGLYQRKSSAWEKLVGQVAFDAEVTDIYAYIDGMVLGFHNLYAPGATVACDTNVTIASPGATLDGETMANPTIVLLIAQTDGTENGLYTWTGAATPMTRHASADTVSELAGGYVVINDGTYAGYSFVCANNGSWTLGVDDVEFGVLFQPSQISFTGGLQLVGNTASIADGGVTNAKLANVATGTIKGRLTAGTGDVEDLTGANARDVLDVDSSAEVDAKIDARFPIEIADLGTDVVDAIYDGSNTEANTIFVDPVNGDDGTAVRERKDLPYETLAAANAASLDGDTLVLANDCASEDLVVRENRKYVGRVKQNSSRPVVQRIIDNNVASPGWTVSNIDAVRTGTGALYIQNSASTGTIRHSTLSNTTFWCAHSEAVIQTKDVIIDHTGAAQPLSTGAGGGFIAAVKGDLTVESLGGAGTTMQSYGRLTNVVFEVTGSCTLWNEATGVISGCEVSADYDGAFAIRNKGRAYFTTARNAGAQGFQNVGSGLAEFCKGYGTGNGVRSGGGVVKGVGFENGESTTANNINVRAKWCEGYTVYDEGMVNWVNTFDEDCYGEAGEDALEGKNHIGCHSVRPRGKTYSTSPNAADMSFQNGNISAHSAATGGANAPCYIVGATIGITDANYNQSAFIQGNNHKFVNCAFANFGGGAVVNISEITGTDSGIEFSNCTSYTTGDDAASAWAIEGTGSLMYIKWRGGDKNTSFGPGIVNQAFDAEERADLAHRYVDVSSNIWGTPQKFIKVADLGEHGGSKYGSGSTFDIVVESRFVGGDINTSVRWRIYKGPTQDAHAGQWIVRVIEQHFAWSTITTKSYKLEVKIEDDAHAWLVMGKDGGTDPTTAKTLRIYAEGLAPDVALVCEEIDSTDDVFVNATSTVTETFGYPATYITNTPAGTIAATNVQAAINELDGDITTLTTLAGTKPDTYAALIGDGSSTTLTVTHGLGTRNIEVICRYASTNQRFYINWNNNASTNSVAIGPFGTAPATDSINVFIIAQ